MYDMATFPLILPESLFPADADPGPGRVLHGGVEPPLAQDLRRTQAFL